MNLPLILSQDYDSYEVVVIDDQSSDSSLEVLNKMGGESPLLHIGSTANTRQGKKYAIRTGIELASNDILVMTDADCAPASTEWLGLMVSPLISGSQFALGVAPLRRTGGIANAFSCYEAGLTYLLYGSAVMLNMPYMGVGRNMAYRKAIAKSYVPDQDFISGDDDLIVNSMALPKYTWLVAHQSAYMYSQGKDTWSSFLSQKRRHVSVSWSYRWKDKVLLALFATTHWLHYVLVLTLLMMGMYQMALILYLARISIVCLQSRNLIPTDGIRFGVNVFLLDFIFVFYYPIIAFFLALKPPKRW